MCLNFLQGKHPSRTANGKISVFREAGFDGYLKIHLDKIIRLVRSKQLKTDRIICYRKLKNGEDDEDRNSEIF